MSGVLGLRHLEGWDVSKARRGLGLESKQRSRPLRRLKGNCQREATDQGKLLSDMSYWQINVKYRVMN